MPKYSEHRITTGKGRSKMKQLLTIGIGLLIALVLTGCWDQKEIGEVNYATAIGIDYDDNKYTLYVQLLDFANVAKQEGSKLSETSPLYIGKGTGSTFMEAVNDLYETSQQSINWGQIGAIIYSESVMEQGIEKVEQGMRRNGEFRYTPWIFGTTESIEKILGESGFFHLPPVYTVLYKPNVTYKANSYIEPLRMYQFNANYKDPGGTTLLPSISVNEGAWKESAAGEKPKGTLEIDGVFPVNEGKYRQWMSREEVRGLRWIDRKTNNTTIKVVQDGESIGTVEVIKPRAHIKPVEEDKAVKFNIKLKAKGQLTGLEEEMPAAEIEQLVKKQMEAEIVSTYQKGLDKDVDVYNLKNIMFHHGMGAKETEAFSLISDSLGKISIDFHLESKGIYD